MARALHHSCLSLEACAVKLVGEVVFEVLGFKMRGTGEGWARGGTYVKAVVRFWCWASIWRDGVMHTRLNVYAEYIALQELDVAAHKIQELISTLDARKDEAIERTFKGVAKHFREVFADLVPGGLASK
eukprot:scaffold3506_cov20-Tisochrysis_lutea.AAC.5